MAKKAWAFKTIEKSDLIYRGNNGYDGDSSSSYAYDNYVANHKNVQEGDIVIIYNRSYIIGASTINKIEVYDSEKEINKCPIPNCDAVKLRTRINKYPEWRCSNGHEFSTPLKMNIPVRKYIAYYSSKYREVGENYSLLESNIIRHNKQLSIQGVNLLWAQDLLRKHLFLLKSTDAKSDTLAFENDDLREEINRNIKLRRGQKTFRDDLLSYSKFCAISNCNIVDILEAAHILPYRNSTHNQTSNGILLRADIHTLFDLDLIAINPINKTIYLSNKLKESEYYYLNGKKVNTNHDISIAALEFRWKIFNLKNS